MFNLGPLADNLGQFADNLGPNYFSGLISTTSSIVFMASLPTTKARSPIT